MCQNLEGENVIRLGTVGCMWHTPNGIRALQANEAALVRASMWHIWDMLEEEADNLADHCEFGIPLFDKMSWQQQLVMLAAVGQALLRDDIPPPELTAVNEATVGALYENISQCVNFEVDADDPEVTEGDATYWRQLLCDAAEIAGERQPPRGPDELLPNADCPDMAEWDILIETLQSSVLWDSDWLEEDLFLDVDPETSRLRKEKLGVSEGYYTAIPPDPTRPEVGAARMILRALVSQPGD